ncbi:hypothetical protein [Rhodococcus kronopolitis]|uniref:PH domain-containing protein n=1 Tax=Rhodococcus kronopolitis TaxID=1460226 RepID=A0ABV9FP56_9NOCA
MKFPWSRRFHGTAQWVTLVVLAVNGILLATHSISPHTAVLLFVGVELPLAGAVVAGLAVGFVAQRRAGSGTRESISAVLGDSPFWPIVRAEIRGYRALWLWLSGRVDGVERGAVAFSSSRGSMVVPVAFAAATVVEVGVLHLLLPWAWLRVVVAVLSIWSLLALLGFLAVERVHPHYLTDTHLVLRQSGTVIASIGRAEVMAASRCLRFSETAPTVVDGRLHLPNADGTTIDIDLGRPVRVNLPALLPSRRKVELVSRISVYVDEPARFVAALRGDVDVSRVAGD